MRLGGRRALILGHQRLRRQQSRTPARVEIRWGLRRSCRCGEGAPRGWSRVRVAWCPQAMAANLRHRLPPPSQDGCTRCAANVRRLGQVHDCPIRDCGNRLPLPHDGAAIHGAVCARPRPQARGSAPALPPRRSSALPCPCMNPCRRACGVRRPLFLLRRLCRSQSSSWIIMRTFFLPAIGAHLPCRAGAAGPRRASERKQAGDGVWGVGRRVRRGGGSAC